MEQLIKEKVKRFIELSKEFTIKSSEVFGENNNILLTGNICSDTYVISSHSENKPQPTRLEGFTISQKNKIEKAERFEEYLKLQCQLSSYFSAVENLEQGYK